MLSESNSINYDTCMGNALAILLYSRIQIIAKKFRARDSHGRLHAAFITLSSNMQYNYYRCKFTIDYTKVIINRALDIN